MTSSSHLKEEAGGAAGFFSIPEKVSGGGSDEEDAVLYVAPAGGGGSFTGDSLAGVSCVAAVEKGGGGRGRGVSGSDCLVFGGFELFVGVPKKLWFLSGDVLFLLPLVLRGGGGEDWSLLWVFALGRLWSLGLLDDFLL